MSREIKFRGKAKDGLWVYGDLNQEEDKPKIRTHDNKLPFNSKFVIPETIGQFTGLKDKSGKEIYEGDICASDVELYSNGNKRYIIYWDNGCFYADDKHPSGNLPLFHFPTNNKEIEVIGNIHDSPELLK